MLSVLDSRLWSVNEKSLVMEQGGVLLIAAGFWVMAY